MICAETFEKIIQEYGNNTTPYHPIALCYLSSGRLWEVKNKRKSQSFSSKSGRGYSLTRSTRYSVLIRKRLVFSKTGR